MTTIIVSSKFSFQVWYNFRKKKETDSLFEFSTYACSPEVIIIPNHSDFKYLPHFSSIENLSKRTTIKKCHCAQQVRNRVTMRLLVSNKWLAMKCFFLILCWI